MNNEEKANKYETAVLILGIFSIISAFSIVGIGLSIILGIAAIVCAKKYKELSTEKDKKVTIGLICGIVSIILSIFTIIFLVILLNFGKTVAKKQLGQYGFLGGIFNNIIEMSEEINNGFNDSGRDFSPKTTAPTSTTVPATKESEDNNSLEDQLGQKQKEMEDIRKQITDLQAKLQTAITSGDISKMNEIQAEMKECYEKIEALSKDIKNLEIQTSSSKQK